MALDFGKLNFSTSFNPTSAFPLDARCYFESKTAADAAALTAEEVGSSNTVYFFGQQIAVLENNKATLYIIDKKAQGTVPETYKGQLVEVGSQALADNNTITLVNNELTLVGFADATNKQVPSKDTATGKIVWSDISGLIPGAVVPVTDNETINVTQDTTDTSKYIISIKGKEAALTGAVLRKHIAEDSTVTYTWDVIYSAAEVDTLLADKVDKVEGSSLMTSAEHTKLENIAENATNVAASDTNGYIKINGTETKVFEQNITVSADGVSDGTTTYKYDDTALAGRVTTVEETLNGTGTGEAHVKGLTEKVSDLETNSQAKLTAENGIEITADNKVRLVDLLILDGGNANTGITADEEPEQP